MIVLSNQQPLESLLRKHAYEKELRPSSIRTKLSKKSRIVAVTSAGDLKDGVELVTKLREDDAASFAAGLDLSVDPDTALATLSRSAPDVPDAVLNLILSMYSLAYFAKKYLPHVFFIPFSSLYHGVLFKLLRDVECHRQTLPVVIAGPREGGKSQIINMMLPVHAAYFPVLVGKPDGSIQDISKRYFVFLGAIQRMAKLPLGDVVTELETNTALHRDFGNLWLDQSGREPGSVGRPWNKQQAVTSNGKLFEAHGRFSKFRGLRMRHVRPDFVSIEDIEDEKSVLSARRRGEDVKWIDKTVMPMVSSVNGNLIASGTMLHENSMLNQLADFGRSHGWCVKVFPVYKDTEHGREYMWPEKFGPEFVKQQLETMPFSAFSQEYLQQATEGHAELSQEQIHYYTRAELDQLIELKRLGIFLGVDPSCKKTEHGDRTAIIPVGFDKQSGVFYVLPAVLDRMGHVARVAAICSMCAMWNPIRVGIETVQYQIALKEAVDEQAKQSGLVIPTLAVPQSGEKLLRISRLFSPVANGTIKFLRGDKTHSIIVDELLHLWDSEHDDGADGLEIAIHTAERILGLQKKSDARKSGGARVSNKAVDQAK